MSIKRCVFLLWSGLACYLACTGHELIGLLLACNALLCVLPADRR